MKNIFLTLSILFTININAQEISAYLKASEKFSDLNSAIQTIEKRISDNNYLFLGKYNPEGNSDQAVIVFTNDELIKLTNSFEDRGSLAAPIRVAFRNIDNNIEVSISNPEYVLNAYLGKKASAKQLQEISKLSKTLSTNILGDNLVGFGGEQTPKQLAKYHYKIMMPYFTDPEELRDFNSFDEGKNTIENNIAKSTNVKLVYKLQIPNKDICIYGLALVGEDGESKFLPKIGRENLAAMPYEMILQGKQATILPGKYRLALFWPELTMGQFMKIVSTPGDIKDAFEAICK